MGPIGALKKLALSLYTGITIAATAVVGPVALLALAVPAAYHAVQGIEYYNKGDRGYAAFEGIKALGVLFFPSAYFWYQFLSSPVSLFFLSDKNNNPNNPSPDQKYNLI